MKDLRKMYTIHRILDTVKTNLQLVVRALTGDVPRAPRVAARLFLLLLLLLLLHLLLQRLNRQTDKPTGEAILSILSTSVG